MGRDDQGLAQSLDRYRVIPRTLCFITHRDDVLLIRGGPQKRLWAGRLNGIGGHVEAHEDIRAALLREIKEETGLEVQNPQLRAVIHVDAADPGLGVMLFVFSAIAATPGVRASSEGSLVWVPRAALPLGQMVEDLPTLLPRILAMGPSDPPLFALYRYDTANRLVISFAGEGQPSPSGPVIPAASPEHGRSSEE